MSYKIKRLIVFSLAIIILAISANEGNKDPGVKGIVKGLSKGISRELHGNTQNKNPYSQIPLSIDPKAIDPDISYTPNPENIFPKLTKKVIIPPLRPLISAEAYLVKNLDTGEIYASHNPRSVFPIASLSKLITSLVAIHIMQANQKITITQDMIDVIGDAGHLATAETFKVSELLYPLLLESSNDTAEALAVSYGYEKFIEQMNGFTKEIGMISSSFKDASGLSSGNLSNTEDLFVLTKYLYLNEKPLLEITRKATMTLASTTEHKEHIWKNINPFSLDPNFLGGKTGRTNIAKESMISIFKYTYDNVSYPIAVIVLRSNFQVREIDSSVLFEQFLQKVINRKL
ncbi:MAG TPA: serine hydrolase [Candidatus Paceibacterota bacterium]